MSHPPGICRAYLVLRMANNPRFCYGGIPDWQDQSLAWWAVADKVVISHKQYSKDPAARLIVDCMVEALWEEG